MATWYEAGLRSGDEVWRSLRGLRARPPVPAGSERRTETFQAALEQAEQQLRAAVGIDPNSRALNLFYGLSQAGRAIAAAHPALTNSDWQLRMHGLSYPPGNDTATNIRCVEVQTARRKKEIKDDDGSSFRRLSVLLNSFQPPSVTLGDVWAQIFDTRFGPTLDHGIYVPVNVTTDTRHNPSGTFVGQFASIDLPRALQDVPLEQRPPLTDYLARYPALADWVRTHPQGVPVGWSQPDTTFTLQWVKPDDLQIGHVLDAHLHNYRGKKIAMPTLPNAEGALHPLLAWWIVLYGLSMLTRYQPATWTQMIDVNHSPDATAIEYLLDVAITAVPDLIDETIATITSAPRSL